LLWVVQEKKALNDLFGSDDSDDDLALDDEEPQPKVRQSPVRKGCLSAPHAPLALQGGGPLTLIAFGRLPGGRQARGRGQASCGSSGR
jgi:hypothetical protein